MATTVVVGLIVAGFLGLLSFLISILASSANYIMMLMMDGSLLRFSETGNLLAILESVFGKSSGLNWVNDTFGMNGFNLAGFIMEASIALIVIIVMLDVISSLFNSMQGQPSENPVKILLRGVLTVILEFVIFGNPFGAGSTWFANKGLLYYFGEFANNLLVPVSQNLSKIDVALSALNLPASFGPAQVVALVALSFALFKGAMEAGIVYVERWLTFALTILFGPVAVAFNASDKTSKSFGDWFMSLITQLLTIMVTIIVFRMYVASLLQLSGISTGTGVTDPLGLFKNLIFNFALSLALLTLFKHSEQILNSIGLRTIASGKTASAYRQGAMSLGRLVSMATRPMAFALGRRMSGDLFHSIYQQARHNYGDNNWITKTARYLDFGEGGRTLDGKGLKVQNGRFVMGSGNGGLFNNSQMSNAQKTVNGALSYKNGIGNVVSMSPVSMVSGLSHMEGLNVSAVGKTGVAISKDENGNPVKNSAIMFSATRSINGVESAPKQYAMVLSDKHLDGSSKLITDNTYDGKYSLSSNNAIPLRDGQGYIYEVNNSLPKLASQEEFASSASLQNKYESYEAYQEAYNNTMLLREEDDRLFNSQGYFPTWKAGTEFMGDDLNEYIDSATSTVNESDFDDGSGDINNYWFDNDNNNQDLTDYETYRQEDNYGADSNSSTDIEDAYLDDFGNDIDDDYDNNE